MTPVVWFRRIVRIVFALLLVSTGGAAGLGLPTVVEGGHRDNLTIEQIDPLIVRRPPASTSTAPRLPVATRGFHTIHSPRHPPATVKTRTDEALHDDDPADDAAEDLSDILPSPDSVRTRDPVAAGQACIRILPAPHPDAVLVSAPPLDLSTPRAPPA